MCVNLTLLYTAIFENNFIQTSKVICFKPKRAKSSSLRSSIQESLIYLSLKCTELQYCYLNNQLKITLQVLLIN
jgi:hypothetical protein